MSAAFGAHESGLLLSDVSTLRYKRGEMLSKAESAEAFVEHVAIGFKRAHVMSALNVALALANFSDDETLSAIVGMTVEDDTVWVDLHNSAKDRRTDFTVLGEEVRKAIEDAGCMPFVIWHSHFSKVGPSKEDWLNFPAWLVSQGLVYTVQSDSTAEYARSVGISDSRTTEEGSPRHG